MRKISIIVIQLCIVAEITLFCMGYQKNRLETQQVLVEYQKSKERAQLLQEEIATLQEHLSSAEKSNFIIEKRAREELHMACPDEVIYYYTY